MNNMKERSQYQENSMSPRPKPVLDSKIGGQSPRPKPQLPGTGKPIRT